MRAIAIIPVKLIWTNWLHGSDAIRVAFEDMSRHGAAPDSLGQSFNNFAAAACQSVNRYRIFVSDEQIEC